MKLNSKYGFLLPRIFVFHSCATVFGGRHYDAVVQVKDHPEADIYYRGQKIGTGSGMIKIQRSKANQINFKLQEAGCADQDISFTSRKSRGWAIAASCISDILWFPFVFNNVIDIANGAYYKPNDSHPMIEKSNYNMYLYKLEYSTCPVKSNIQEYVKETKKEVQQEVSPSASTKKEKLLELDALLEEGIISEEEHKAARMKILEQ